jgi:hypothetical protein
VKKAFSNFTIDHGDGVSDPLGGDETYHVLQHNSRDVFLFLDPETFVGKYMAEISDGRDEDYYMYFPEGILADDTTGETF